MTDLFGEIADAYAALAEAHRAAARPPAPTPPPAGWPGATAKEWVAAYQALPTEERAKALELIVSEFSAGRVLSERDAAAYVDLSVSSLRKFRAEGGGPRYIKKTDRSIGYRVRDLDTWIESRVRRSTTDATVQKDAHE